MPDVDVPLPLPGPEDSGGTTSTEGDAMAATIDVTIEKVLDQAYSRAHEDWLATQQRSNAADAFLSEVTRLTFGAAASMQVQLAGGILAQRSAQYQPQVGVKVPGTV